MRPHVTVQLEERRARVVAGGLIGRTPSAALRLDDPRISEAHALVSLRAGRLLLIGLANELRVGRQRVQRVQLTPGQRVGLTDDLWLQVLEVVLPSSSLAIEGLGVRPVVLDLDVGTFHRDPPRLEPGFDPRGEAHLWSSGDGWSVRRGDEVLPLVPGTEFDVVGSQVRVIEVPPVDAGGTQRSLVAQDTLRLVIRFTSVHVHRAGRPPVALAGVTARILTELARFASPVPWDWVAREVWGPLDRDLLRTRWDRNLRTLRRKLREIHVRPDLVFADGRGNVELVLGPDDRVVDDG
ncbi:MAG: FHA domain-containing protein [Myxococcales bacterium]|nr:FHA domain-containing protein [Myxococcales bacterium]